MCGLRRIRQPRWLTRDGNEPKNLTLEQLRSSHPFPVPGEPSIRSGEPIAAEVTGVRMYDSGDSLSAVCGVDKRLAG